MVLLGRGIVCAESWKRAVFYEKLGKDLQRDVDGLFSIFLTAGRG